MAAFAQAQVRASKSGVAETTQAVAWNSTGKPVTPQASPASAASGNGSDGSSSGVEGMAIQNNGTPLKAPPDFDGSGESKKNISPQMGVTGSAASPGQEDYFRNLWFQQWLRQKVQKQAL